MIQCDIKLSTDVDRHILLTLPYHSTMLLSLDIGICALGINVWYPHTKKNLFKTQTSVSATFIHMLFLNFRLHCNPLCIIIPYLSLFPAVTLSLKQHCHSGRPIVFCSAWLKLAADTNSTVPACALQ